MIAARPDGIIATPYATRMFQQLMFSSARSEMRRHCERGIASGVPTARNTEKRMTAPPARQSVRKDHGATSASDTFIAVQLNPQANVSPAKTHQSLRGSRSSAPLAIGNICAIHQILMLHRGNLLTFN
jgi:hypothetical protein